MGLYNEKILIVNAEKGIRNVLYKRLSLLGYRVSLVTTGKEALQILRTDYPHLVLLDLILPNLDGYEICYNIRKYSKVPIILLTALKDVTSRVEALEIGADDFLIKPFSLKELEARIRAILRRTNYDSNTTLSPNRSIRFDTLSVNWDQRSVVKKNSKINLTRVEFRLLELLFENSGKILSRSVILNNIWGYTPERDVDTRIVDVHISRLRSKLEDNSRKPDFILTVRGKGYVFNKYCKL